MYDDDPWFRRIPGAGALLGLFLLAAVGYPLWHFRHVSHPLAGETQIDLCARLAGARGLASFHAESFVSAGAAGACRWRDGDRVALEATLSTTRGSGGMDLHRMFDTWGTEAKASYGPTAGLVERGEASQRVMSYRTGDGRVRLVEDDGVLLYLSSPTLDDAAFDSLLEPIRSALRTGPTPPR